MTNSDFHRSADIATLADEWEASARKHIAAGNEEDCEAGTEEWMLHAESARIYRKCADQLVTALAKGIINVAQAERVWHRKDCPFCGSPDGQYSASVGELSAAFFCKGCGINQPAHPPAAPVETDAAKMCNSYLERALKAEAALAAHNGSSAASEPAAWLVTWTTKNNGPTASAYVRERDARDAARNVEKYADASNVVVAPAYTDLPQPVQVPEGYALVPLRPTQEMIETGCDNNPTQWSEGTDRGFPADVASDVYVSMVRFASSMTRPERG